jgi:GYF domain 2
MYRIIGADQKEYGPVTADQIRGWIAEGRANAQTQVRLESELEWRPISSFPEFAAALSSGAPVPGPGFAAFQTPAGTREAALAAIKGPAIALLVTAILGLLAAAFSMIMSLAGMAAGHNQMPEVSDPELRKMLQLIQGTAGPMQILQHILGLAVGVAILMGSLRMMKLQNYQFSFVATILAMVPCISPCCLLGLPFGIWALVILNRPDVKSHFT